MNNICNCVYRFLNKNDEIIYIGKAKDLKSRLKGHTHLPKECYEERVKIEYTKFDTEDDIDYAERYFISKVKPKYNEIHKGKDITIKINRFDIAVWHDMHNDVQDFIKTDSVEVYKLNKKINNYKIKLEDVLNRCKVWREIKEEKTIELMKKFNIKTHLYVQENDLIMYYDKNYEEQKIQDRECSEYSNYINSHNMLNKLIDEKEKLQKKINKLKEDRLYIVCDKELDKERKYLYLKYETFNDKDTINLIWEEIKKKYIEELINELEQTGYYNHSRFLEKMCYTFKYNSYLEEYYWIKILINCNDYTQDHEQSKYYIEKMIGEIEAYLENIFGRFILDTFIVEDYPTEYSSLGCKAIKIPRALLVKRVS